MAASTTSWVTRTTVKRSRRQRSAYAVGDLRPAASTAAIRTRLIKLIIVLLRNFAPSFGGHMDRRGHGMDWLVMRSQKMAQRHVPVSAIDQIVVIGDEPVPIPPI